MPRPLPTAAAAYILGCPSPPPHQTTSTTAHQHCGLHIAGHRCSLYIAYAHHARWTPHRPLCSCSRSCPFAEPGQAGRQTRSTEFRSLFSYTTPHLSSARKKPRTLYACSQQCWACCSDGRSSATQDGKLSRTDHRARVHGTMWVPALLVFCLCGGAVGQLSAPVAHDGHVSTDGNKFLQNSATLDSGAL